MKKVIAVIVCTFMILSGFPVFAGELQLSSESVILMEAETGTVLYEMNADKPLPPASVTKIMTVLLVMEAIEKGRIELKDKVSISERAANMGGSQVYLEPGEEMTVDELLKCVVVASANDAATALAEYCSGSEEAFVNAMNVRAEELGMNNTHFENTNGLDDTTKTHLTTARDIAIMSKQLLKHEKIFDYTTIWMDTIRNGAFGLTNTNRLIRFYKGANGLKTGSTSKAGFCISATAKRDGLQLIAVIMASPTRNERNQTAVKLLDYGFANYAFYEDHAEDIAEISIPIIGSMTDEITVQCNNGFKKLISKSDKGKIERSITVEATLSAPVKKGNAVGSIVYTLNGIELGSVTIVAKDDAKRIGFYDLLKISIKKLAIF